MKTYIPEGLIENEKPGDISISSVLSESKEKGEILEGKALLCDKDHNLFVDYFGVRGVIPRVGGALGVEEGTTKDIAIISRVGKSVCFIVDDMSKENEFGCPIFSRRLAQKQCLDTYLMHLVPGDIIKGKITHMEHFGAFIDIGCGIPTLLPIDRISVSRITHPSDRFSVGDVISVIVVGIEGDRIHVSHKELLGSWDENASGFSIGETVQGYIRSVEDYGVFVELTPNLAGLAEPFEGAKKGLVASVYIKSIIPQKMKLKLTIVDCFEGPSPSKLKYFVDSDYMNEWRYSPDACEKEIVTYFGQPTTSVATA